MKTIKIKDYYGNYQEVPVSDELYEEMREFHREEDRLHKRAVYHGCYYSLDEMADTLASGTRDNIIDDIIRREEVAQLYDAIAQLTPLQRSRIQMILEDMSYADIARVEGRDASVIRRSILQSIKNLRKLMGK